MRHNVTIFHRIRVTDMNQLVLTRFFSLSFLVSRGVEWEWGQRGCHVTFIKYTGLSIQIPFAELRRNQAAVRVWRCVYVVHLPGSCSERRDLCIGGHSRVLGHSHPHNFISTGLLQKASPSARILWCVLHGIYQEWKLLVPIKLSTKNGTGGDYLESTVVTVLRWQHGEMTLVWRLDTWPLMTWSGMQWWK